MPRGSWVCLDCSHPLVTIGPVWLSPNSEIITALALCVLVGVAVYGSSTILLRMLHRYVGKWRLVTIKGEFTTEHHLPDEIPVPKNDAERVSGGEFSFDEAVGSIEQFVHQRRFHHQRPEFQVVLRKYELYREMAKKMGRGMWCDVDKLGQRLAELDPLDPSARRPRPGDARSWASTPGRFASTRKHWS